MDAKLILILTFAISCIVFGGLATFSDSFNRQFIEKKQWKNSEARKVWSDKAISHYSRYGIGLGTFICGVIVLASLLIRYLQL
jgi:hypothetical protein